MPYIWLDGMRLYSDHETEAEKRMKEYKRQWQRANRKGKKYSQKTKIKQPVKMKEKIICDCGGGYLYKTSKYNHEKSKKHINYYKEKQLQEELNTISEVIEPTEIL